MSASWKSTAFAVLIISLALAGTLLFANMWQPSASAEAKEAASVVAGLEARIAELEAKLSDPGTQLSSDAERNLARLADALEDASDRWLREISGHLGAIASELQYIRRAVER